MIPAVPKIALGILWSWALSLLALSSLMAFPRQSFGPEKASDEKDHNLLGTPSNIGTLLQDQESIWLHSGQRLHREPSSRSITVAVIDVDIEVSVLDQRSDWLRVRLGSIKGWINPSNQVIPLPVRSFTSPVSPDPNRLIRARSFLQSGDSTKNLGPFALYTDTQNLNLLAQLGAAAANISTAYRERYGIDPGQDAAEAIILFSRQEDYRTYERSEITLEPLGSYGHAGSGIATLFIGQQSPAETEAILIHELTHLLNRRVFGVYPAPWLEEGIANDLAYCRVDRSGRFHLESLGGKSVVIDHPVYLPGGWSRVDQEVRLQGPKAALNLLRHRWQDQTALPLDLLLELVWEEYIDPLDRPSRYDESTFFIRYLLDGEDQQLAERFRAFLSLLASGEPADTAIFLKTLDRDWRQLEAGFGRWLIRRQRLH